MVRFRKIALSALLLTGILVVISTLPSVQKQSIAVAEESPVPVVELIALADLDKMKTFPGDLGALPEVTIPKDNPMSPEKISLGKRLFFDTRLSGDNRFSCAWCHNPALGFGDGLPRASGFDNKELDRHSPTVINAAYYKTQFWDGRAATLEEQAQMPIISHVEMNLPAEKLLKKLRAIPSYQKSFQKVFKSDISMENVGKAIAAYERTLISRNTPYDHYMRGEKTILTDQQKRGFILFMSRAACSRCHNGPNLSDDKFHNLALPQAGPLNNDPGRFKITGEKKDMGAFKTSALRNVELTAPYMHNGALATLEDVVVFYNTGGGDDPNKSLDIFELHLSEKEQQDLVAFLKSLTDPSAETGFSD